VARDHFEAVQNAYEVLGSEEARIAHDAARRSYADQVAPLPAGLVERFIGVRRSEAPLGRNRLYRLTVSSRDAITGDKYEIDLPDAVSCRPCGGTGLAPMGRPVLCDVCGGRCFSVVRPVLRAVGEPCERCHAAGWVPNRPCEDCQGSGSVAGVRVVTVAVPAGIADKAQLRLSGHGEAPPSGGDRGDLIVAVDLADGDYRVAGDDWEADAGIPFWRALAGGPWTVQTPWGERVIKLHQGTRDGDLLCLAGLGVGKRGDGYLRVTCIWPTALTRAERDSLVAWGEALSSPLVAVSKEQVS